MREWEEKRLDPEFKRLSAEKSKAIEPLQEIADKPTIRHREIVETATHGATRVLELIQHSLFRIAIICAVVWFATCLLYAIGVALLFLIIAGVASSCIKHQTETALQVHAQELHKLEELANEAEARIRLIERDYDERIRAHCDTFPSYPADWDERRRLVMVRDNHACTACGWPRGFQRRARELHVHHIKSLSDDGTNMLSNLTTLCHICHRKIDSKHEGVQKLGHGPKRRKRR
jgi:5-methylcytosine-specific restriction endonuclease McrA